MRSQRNKSEGSVNNRNNQPYGYDDEKHKLVDEIEVDAKSATNYTTSSFQSFWNIVKTFAGAGSFGLPWAIYQSGIVAGALGMIFFALLANYTMRLLVECRKQIHETNAGISDNSTTPSKRTVQYYEISDGSAQPASLSIAANTAPIDEPLTYMDVGRAALGRVGEAIVYVLLLTCNLGVCTVYLVLFGILMHSLVPALDVRVWFLATLPLFVPMAQIRSYKYLAPTSILGTIALLLAMGTVVYAGSTDGRPLHWPWQDPFFWIRPKTLPLFIGVNSFLFNTHAMVLPIEQSMRNRPAYPMTLNLAFLFVTVTNLAFAVVVYLFFGVAIKDNATANLPAGSIFVMVVKICLCIELLLTYAVVLMPVSSALEAKLLTRYLKSPDSEEAYPTSVTSTTPTRTKKFYLASAILRTLLVVLTLGVAEIFGANFGLVMDFIGGLSPNALGFITPSLFYILLCRKKISWIGIVVNVLIIIFGFACMFLSTGVVIYRIITGQE